MTPGTSRVRVRIAPSPTGDPHVGTAYIGQINEVFARQRGGDFVLRIEDTDQTRSSPLYEQAIFESLRWFGLRWDEGPDVGGPYGPYRQSERTEIYREHTGVLLARGGGYRCFCTEERLDALRAELKAQKSQSTGYDGHCRHLSAEEVQAKLDAGLPFVVRLKMPKEGETVFKDGLRGDVHFQNNLIDDQVLIKSDGFPTYHFANVVDDHLMEITHVIRAEEWINSTPKHVILYQAFGWQAPEFIHMPLLRNADHSKISKRKNPTSLIYYRQAGYLPEAMRNFLALMGWTPADEVEKFTHEQMVKNFDIYHMSLGGPIFDLKKLKWLNGTYIRDMGLAELTPRASEILFNPHYIAQIMPLVHERMETFDDFWTYADYFFLGEVSIDMDKLIPKGKTAAEARKVLGTLMDRLEQLGARGWAASDIEVEIRAHCETSGWSMKELFMATRLTVTGRAATPPLHDVMAVMGKERIRRRFHSISEKLKTMK